MTEKSPLPLAQLAQFTERLEGWLTEREGKLLYALARKSRGAIVEIGSYKGKSTIWLAAGGAAGRGEKVFAIDPHRGEVERGRDAEDSLAAFQKNIEAAGFSDYVVPLIARSEEVALSWRKPIGLLWIDGAHDAVSVVRDLRNFSPWVISGGWIALHDSFEPGPLAVIVQEICRQRDFAELVLVDSITCARKRRATWRDQAKKTFFLLGLLAYLLARKLPLSKGVRGKLKKTFGKLSQFFR